MSDIFRLDRTRAALFDELGRCFDPAKRRAGMPDDVAARLKRLGGE